MTNPELPLATHVRTRNLLFCLIHFLGWLFLLVYIPLFWLPKLKEAWEEFEIILNPLSKIFVSWSEWVVAYCYAWVPLILFIVFGASAWMFYSPKSSLRNAAKTISLLLLGLTLITIAIGLGLPSLSFIPG